jgi:zinc finger protein 830
MLGQAINTIKASAAGLTRANNVKAEPHKELIKSKPERSTELHSFKPERSTESQKNQSSSVLPPDFFDNNEMKKQKTGKNLYLIFHLFIITIICQYYYYLV